MKTMGFPISHKENEKRRALVPGDLVTITNRSYLYFETGYGEVLGYTDDDYSAVGAHVVEREKVFEQDIICNPKSPEPHEYGLLKTGQTLFGWIHAVQGKEITDFLTENRMTAIAWEDMFEGGRHVFWRNNELAGEAAILHSFTLFGKCPAICKVAVLGRGNTARGATRILERLGCDVTVYDRVTTPLLRRELGLYDVVVNAVLWDVFRTDRILYLDDLAHMKSGSMIVDVSCNHGLELESTHPTTIEEPTYTANGVLHYAVDHTPSLVWKSATDSISTELRKYVDDLVEERHNPVLDGATIIRDGVILDSRITRFQQRHVEGCAQQQVAATSQGSAQNERLD